MAAFEIKATLLWIQSHLAASGYLPYNRIGEPKQDIAEELGAAVWLTTATVTQVPLGGSPGTEEVHTVTIRFYMNMLSEPQEQIEFRLMEAVSKLSEDLLGDFTLGGTIRNIDVGGQSGQGLQVTYGFIEIGGTMYRSADLGVPMIVDNAITLAP